MQQELKIIIPTTLDDIPLNKYIQWNEIKEQGDANETEIAALRLFSGLSRNQTSQLHKQSRDKMLEKITKALVTNPDYRPTFRFKDTDYGIEPNLDLLTYGQFVDLDTIKEYKKNLPKLMALLYRPITKKVGSTYEIEPTGNADERQKLFEELPTGIALGALVFFWTIGNDCLTATRNYIRQQATSKPHTDEWVKNGDGIATSIAYASKISGDLMKLQEYLTTPSCFGSHMNQTWRLQINYQHELLPRNRPN